MEHEGHRSFGRTVAAFAIALLMLLAALSLWTAIPLLWLFIGSRIADTQFPTMGPYLIVLFGVIASILVVGWAIGKLNAAYTRLTGTHTVGPIRLGWMKNMSDRSNGRPASLMEAVVVGSVLIAGVAMVAWFFLLAGSPVPM